MGNANCSGTTTTTSTRTARCERCKQGRRSTGTSKHCAVLLFVSVFTLWILVPLLLHSQVFPDSVPASAWYMLESNRGRHTTSTTTMAGLVPHMIQDGAVRRLDPPPSQASPELTLQEWKEPKADASLKWDRFVDGSKAAGVDSSPTAPRIVVAGLVMDTHQVRESTWELLHDLSCQYHALIHIVAKHVDEASRQQTRHWNCGPVHLEVQDDVLWQLQHSPDPTTTHVPPRQIASHRIQRLAQIRDLQRERIRRLVYPTGGDHQDDDVVILLDLDLWSFPTAAELVQRSRTMHTFQVVCGAGHWVDHPVESAQLQWKQWQEPRAAAARRYAVPKRLQDMLFYYDNYAFVAWPDTFGFVAKQRLLGRYYQGEDPSIIPNTLGQAKQAAKHHHSSKHVVFTQYDLMQYLQQQANDYSAMHKDPSDSVHQDDNLTTTGKYQLAPVRSCFGGVALYRASTWFTPQCQYDLLGMIEQQQQQQAEQLGMTSANSSLTVALSPPRMQLLPHDPHLSTNILRYAAKKEQLPCEHVVFHDCLHRVVFSPKDDEPHVAVDPHLLTAWKKNVNEDDDTKNKNKNKKKKQQQQKQKQMANHNKNQAPKATGKQEEQRASAAK